MSGFDAGWLDLREPADARARHPGLARMLAAWLAPGTPLTVLDLGCGTGANLRWLAPRLPVPQRWRLVDHDPALLAALPDELAAWAHRRGRTATPDGAGLSLGDHLHASWTQQDLAADLPALAGVHLVTASALADLVSRDWLAGLVAACAPRRAAVLLALTYDGRMAIRPFHRHDPRVRDAVNRHQFSDKGFGPALGPGAPAAAAALLRAAGYRVVQAHSDWRLGPADAGLAEELVGEWAEVAARDRPRPAGWTGEWLDARLGGHVAITVGHVDLLALPSP